MRVPLLNIEGGPGVLLLNFEGGPGVPLLNFRGVPGPAFKLWGGPGSKVPKSRGPESGVLLPILHYAMSYVKDLIIQICYFIKKRLQHRCFPMIIANC